VPCAHDEPRSSLFQSTIYSIFVHANGFLTSSKDGLVKQWTRDFTSIGQPVAIPCSTDDNEGNSVGVGARATDSPGRLHSSVSFRSERLQRGREQRLLHRWHTK
jgi:hypothetical protein